MKKASEPRNSVVFYLNGQRTLVSGDEALLNLSDYLRRRKSLTGTKIVCAEGDCGACSILRAVPRSEKPEDLKFEVINSCIARVAQLDGSFIVSIEGIGDEGQRDPIQDRLLECNGSQCGFCTPGFVVAMADHFEDRTQEKDLQKLKNSLTGNLCRCTGYQAILDAGMSVERKETHVLRKRFVTKEKIADLLEQRRKRLQITGSDEVFEAPTDLQELAEARTTNPDSLIIAAGTDLGVQRNKHFKVTPKLLSLHLIPELYEVEVKNQRASVGARVTLSDLRTALKESAPDISHFLNIFASPQIKNCGTLIGNLANASPIADTPPFLLALNAILKIWNPQTQKVREVPLDSFYLGYKKLDLQNGEVILSVHFDLPQKNDRLYLKKISQRRDLDISTVNTAFWISASKKDFRLAIGGVAATPLRLKKTESLLKASGNNAKSLDKILAQADEEITPLSDLRGSSAYRRLLVRNLLKDFLNQGSQDAQV